MSERKSLWAPQRSGNTVFDSLLKKLSEKNNIKTPTGEMQWAD